MKKIEDYLKFYIGCEFVMQIKNSHHLTKRLVFDAAALGASLSKKDNIKPILILRQLSSMTEEEANKYNELSTKMYSLNKLQDQMKTDAECTKYLLSLHFDLFDLIHHGLAIDKASIKQ